MPNTPVPPRLTAPALVLPPPPELELEPPPQAARMAASAGSDTPITLARTSSCLARQPAGLRLFGTGDTRSRSPNPRFLVGCARHRRTFVVVRNKLVCRSQGRPRRPSSSSGRGQHHARSTKPMCPRISRSADRGRAVRRSHRAIRTCASAARQLTRSPWAGRAAAASAPTRRQRVLHHPTQQRVRRGRPADARCGTRCRGG